jgi:predicted glutamine amidotransferase
MCIALLVKPEAEITDATLTTCHKNNSDGSGFAYIKDGVMTVFKTMEFDEFLSAFKVARGENPESPFIVHFRIRTHGTTDTFNCHPFFIDDKTTFIHNGIINKVSHDLKKSDTQMFNEEILQGLPEGWQFNMSIKPLIEDFIGFSKLVVLNSEGEWEIFNEKKGEWNEEETVWFSNSSYKPRKTYNYTNYYSKKKDNTTVPAKKSTTPSDLPYQTGYNTTSLDAWKIDIKTSTVPCDNCIDYNLIADMTAYDGLEGTKLYCKDCEGDLIDAEFIDPADKVSIHDYVTQYNRKLETANGYTGE